MLHLQDKKFYVSPTGQSHNFSCSVTNNFIQLLCNNYVINVNVYWLTIYIYLIIKKDTIDSQKINCKPSQKTLIVFK